MTLQRKTGLLGKGGFKLPIDEAWLKRSRKPKPVKFDLHEWEKMNWFVNLAKTDLHYLRAGDLLNLQEEFLEKKRRNLSDEKPAPPTLEEIEAVQKQIATHLQELVDKGETTLGPFERMTIVVNPSNNPSPDALGFLKALLSGPPASKKKLASITSFSVDVITKGDSIIHDFSELLRHFNSSLRRCRFCSGIFLQLRRNALYCNRKCQSVAAMREIRARSLKRRLRHGKTRR